MHYPFQLCNYLQVPYLLLFAVSTHENAYLFRPPHLAAAGRRPSPLLEKDLDRNAS